MARAIGAWPGQAAYRLSQARLAARMGQEALALAELDAIILLGAGWTDDDPIHTLLAAEPGYATRRDRMREVTAPLRRSTLLARLPDTMFHPEGIAWDGARHRWLVSSIRRRKVVQLDPDGVMREFLPPAVEGLDAVFGLAVDSVRGLLWLASTAVPNQEGYVAGDSGRSALCAFDLTNGALRRRITGPRAPGAHAFGDLTLAPDGTVYLSDGREPAIYRLPPGGGVLEVVAAGNPLLRSPQGLALTPDGRSLYVADWSHGLLRVELASGAIRVIPLEGPGTLLGLDGLLMVGGRLVGLQNGIAPPRVVGLTLDGAGDRVTRLEVLDRHLPLATEPTLAALGSGALVYVANSPWANYADDGTPLPGQPWAAPVLLRLAVP